jgi:hypothetical protein
LLLVLVDTTTKQSGLKTGFQYLLIFCASAFIGGASESYALSAVFLLVFYLLASNLRLLKNAAFNFPAGRALNFKISFALLVLAASFTVTMLAPGNKNRLDLLPHAGFAQLCWVQVKSFIKIVFIRTPAQLPFLLLFSTPWFVLGQKCAAKEMQSLVSFLKRIVPYFFLSLFFVFVFLMPTSFVMVELGPDRSLSFITFFIAFCFAAFFFSLGQNVKVKNLTATIFKVASLIGIGCVVLFFSVEQFPLAKKYSLACDQRKNYLQELQRSGNHKTIELAPLPPSGCLFSSEISSDSLHGLNYLVEKSLRLDFKVKVGTGPAYK